MKKSEKDIALHLLLMLIVTIPIMYIQRDYIITEIIIVLYTVAIVITMYMRHVATSSIRSKVVVLSYLTLNSVVYYILLMYVDLPRIVNGEGVIGIKVLIVMGILAMMLLLMKEGIRYTKDGEEESRGERTWRN